MDGFSEIVGFLDKYSPAKLAKLRERFADPDVDRLLKAGVELGPEIEGKGVDLDIVRCAAALVAMDVVLEELAPIQDKAIARLRRARRIDALGAILATVGSGTAIAALSPSSTSTTVAYWASVTGLIGSLIAVASEHLRAPILGSARSISTLLLEVQDVRSRSTQIQPLLRYFSQQSPDLIQRPTAQEAILDAQKLTATTRSLIAQLS
ncbi:hypothetical protein [Paucibacter sp. M5-1]|uniref:hypothetical protein n=1 Tax=Paucibacter sp. M5-1 TaxID=3015998 RepID=UPI0022B8B748|nr:hypothetical protein [Paucibacter sp. M5-1]MCZ7881256.1 hypothetical protein [Paucibacter sp. M5-1]